MKRDVSAIVATTMVSIAAVSGVGSSSVRPQPQHGVIVGVVRDAASGKPLRRSFVSATVFAGGRIAAIRMSPVDSATGAYRLDSIAGVARLSVYCSTIRPMIGKELAADSIAVPDSVTIRRDWTVSSAGCDPRPIRHVSGIFRGRYTPGFESSDFVPCAADAWFIPGDSLQLITAYDPRRAWVTWSPNAHRVAWPDSAPRDGYGNPQFYVRWRGTVTGPGSYGHMGVSPFEFRVDSVLEIRALGKNDCPAL